MKFFKEHRTLVFIFFIIFLFGIFSYRASRLSRPPSIIPETSFKDDIVPSGILADGIPAIDDPSFESVSEADRYLQDEGMGIAVDVRGHARFYPYQILVWHEIVNDTFRDKELAITYSPLCFSDMVFERAVDEGEEPLVFGVSDKFLNNNLVLFDRESGSLWNQLLGRAIDGEREGAILKTYPSIVMSWQAFKQTYPFGEVLSLETGFDRDYTYDPYDTYLTDDRILFPLTSFDDRVSPKEVVYANVDELGTARATREPSEDGMPVFWFCWVAMYPETEVGHEKLEVRSEVGR